VVRRISEPTLSRQLRGQVLETLVRATELIDEPMLPTRAARASFGPAAARGWLDDVWRQASGQLTSGTVSPQRLSAFVDLLGQVRECEAAMREQQMTGWSALRRQVSDSMASLTGAGTVAEAGERVPESVSRLGFDRVMVSSIDDAIWIPEATLVPGDENWAQEILEAGRASRRILDDSLLETQIVRHQAALVVTETARLTNLHHELIAATRTRSYVAAPVVSGRTVIGFVHADFYHQQRLASAADRDLLWMYCDELRHLLARTATQERIQTLRTQFDELIHGPQCITPGRSSHVPPPDGTATSIAPTAETAVPAPTSLTPREIDVVRLLCRGLTNAQISRALSIGEGTVKSHVKHILQKLGAANRAEAVSIWIRQTRGQHH
jgi:DNA-binding CsgD family transcriptional regulator